MTWGARAWPDFGDTHQSLSPQSWDMLQWFPWYLWLVAVGTSFAWWNFQTGQHWRVARKTKGSCVWKLLKKCPICVHCTVDSSSMRQDYQKEKLDVYVTLYRSLVWASANRRREIRPGEEMETHGWSEICLRLIICSCAERSKVEIRHMSRLSILGIGHKSFLNAYMGWDENDLKINCFWFDLFF
jgi:hypothetical protein